MQSLSNPNGNCVNASRAHAYSTFNGNNTIPAELYSVAQYLTVGDTAYGWTQATCSALNAYICGLPFSVFTCYPPPSPPKPPPVPPTPPRPPMPPHGALLHGMPGCSAQCADPLPHPTASSLVVENLFGLPGVAPGAVVRLAMHFRIRITCGSYNI
jgi:hypothetical protein